MRNLLLTCSTILASAMSLVFAAPCYTTTPDGCNEEENLIFIEKSTSKSGNLCTDFINPYNQRVVFCYPKSTESGYRPRSFGNNAYTQTGGGRTVVTIIPDTTSHSSRETSSNSAPVTIQSSNDDNAYWQGYNRGYGRANSGEPYEFWNDNFKPVGRNDHKTRAGMRPVKQK